MNSIQELAQWVVNNRHPRKSKVKTSDLQMFNTILFEFEKLQNKKNEETCTGRCEWIELEDKTSVCKNCGMLSPF